MQLSSKTKCTVNKKSSDAYRNYYDYRDDIPDHCLAENDAPGTSFNVHIIEPEEEVENLADQWTIILLHGLNSDYKNMLPFVELWQVILPEARFILPNASSIPVTMNMHFEMPAWHDLYEVGTENVPEQGWPQLAHSVTRIRKLIRQEVARGVPSEHIILSGFSQGGHLAFATAFNTDIPLGGVVSFSGFYSNPNYENAVREIVQCKNKSMPVWMCHGTSDSVILYKAAVCSYDALTGGGVSVHHVKYEGMEHIYNNTVIRDAGQWIRNLMDGFHHKRNIIDSRTVDGKKK